VAPGSARVIACLQEHREQLSPQCASRLFQHEVRLAEDIGERAGPFRRSCLFDQGLGCVQPKELWHEDAGESGMPLLVAAAARTELAFDWAYVEDYLRLFKLEDRLPELKSSYGPPQ